MTDDLPASLLKPKWIVCERCRYTYNESVGMDGRCGLTEVIEGISARLCNDFLRSKAKTLKKIKTRSKE